MLYLFSNISKTVKKEKKNEVFYSQQALCATHSLSLLTWKKGQKTEVLEISVYLYK